LEGNLSVQVKAQLHEVESDLERFIDFLEHLHSGVTHLPQNGWCHLKVGACNTFEGKFIAVTSWMF
jgi:hypothetical protein